MTVADQALLGAFDEAAPVGLAVARPDGVLVAANAALCGLAGRTRDELVGRRRFSELLTVGGRIYFETHLAPLLHGEGRFREAALELRRPDGTQVSVLAGAVRRGDDDDVAWLIAVLDASDRRDYERALLETRGQAQQATREAKELARALARSLLPPRPPEVPGLELASAYHPAGDGAVVGGDFYDVFQLAPDRWVALIGDVCGKGPAAAAVTALARHTLRAAFVRSCSPAAALRLLHDVLLREDGALFCTLSVLVLDREHERWSVTHSTGGHSLPLVRRSDGAVTEVGARGSLVGAVDEPAYPETCFHLDEGDLLLMHTDGVTEARSGGDFFGDERVVEALRHSGSAEALVGNLVDKVLGFQGGPPRDDVAVLAMRAWR